MKRVFSIFIVLVLALSMLSSCTNEKTEPKSGMLFWEATDKKGNKIYLLGSIHVGEESLYPLNDIIMDAFEESDALAVEADIDKVLSDTQLQIKVLQEYMYVDGTTIEDHVDASLIQEAKNILNENDQYNESFVYIKPMFWADMISSISVKDSKLTSEHGVDLYFIKEAKRLNKELLEIESVEGQAKMLANMSDDIQELYLSDALINIDKAEESVNELFKLWKSGDDKKLEEYIFSDSYPDDVNEDVKELYDEYLEIIYTNRNVNMVSKAEEYIKSGKTVFYVVGSAHMVGESGIVNQLIAKGYKVEKK